MKIILSILIVVIVLLGAGVLVVGPRVGSGGGLLSFSSSQKGTEVRVEHVTRRELVQSVPAPGLIEPHTKVDISSRVVSQIVALPFREGENVRKGDLVVVLDDRDLSAQLEGAEARRESAVANLDATRASRARARASLEEQIQRRSGLVATVDFARRNLERKQDLFDSGDISMAELDQALERVVELESQLAAMDTMIAGAESSLEQADAQIMQADAAVKQADAEIRLVRENLRNTRIESPIDGKVVKLNAEVGETVMTGTMNNPGTVIMTIADLSRMRMKAQVDESRVAGLEDGQIARVLVNSYEDRVFSGVVDRIALQMSRNMDGSGFYETIILLRLDDEEILAGGNANAEIEIAKHNGLIVPSQSVVDRDIEDLPDEVIAHPLVDRSKRIIRVAYRVVDGKAVATPVRVGASDWTHTIILEGLDEGDQIISGPYKVLDVIKHNEAVSVIGTAGEQNRSIPPPEPRGP